jgi:hypothetical protein
VNSFLRDVEDKKITPLIGGDAMRAVAEDKDVKPMSIEDIVRTYETK